MLNPPRKAGKPSPTFMMKRLLEASRFIRRRRPWSPTYGTIVCS